MNIQRLFKPYIVKRDHGQCQVLIPLVELDDLCERIERGMNATPVSCISDYEYAASIARSLWKRYYAEVVPEWEVCDTMFEVLSQIDNMTCMGLPPVDSRGGKPEKIHSELES